ncbi:cytochrome o ubiquinol oxidase subunit I [Vitreoscilla stercoraria]|uniref:Cytochrome o ubiquinol oxidase subunit I n=1 Tax=Vitreoscilla stercoraria TaxID=61 RepID=A0ABY4EBC8_VITST|nr:cytochrome o ubiquinol oxidase subunit I [Vitreoscilla stercoraria]UOO93056.1 cytochrome o ubiquinol oxidase subunit I [Vitreoscilla stercoraria]
MLGKLDWSAIPGDPIVIVTMIAMALGGIAVVGALTYFKKWGYLWSEWFTSVDHKRLGIMYIIVSLVMLVRGFADAFMMRLQLSMAASGGPGYLTPEHYDQIFTAHGVIMIFFVAMGLVVGLMNVVVPLQIGARDVAYPLLNNFSFWLFVSGVILVMASLVIGEFAAVGWLAYPPLSGIDYSPGVGVDYYIWALQLSGLGTLLTGVNMVVTILRMRTPSMSLMQMPIFTWTTLVAAMMILATFPVLTATLAMLTVDRVMDFHFFTNDLGGSPMLYVNLIWTWGHPEVYILVLPAFGIFSEVVSTFSGKRLFGYRGMVYASGAIAVLSMIVWVHHFFTMGAGPSVNAFFGIMTMVIAIPTGVKIFNWIFTMYKGKIRFEVPMLWAVGFLVTFTVGGMTGVLLSIPPADFVVHNSLFLVAHFHNTIIGGVVFGLMAGLTFWWPKMFGFKLNDRLGRASFWCWFWGFWLAFVPLYILGFMGMTRRMNTIGLDHPEWAIYLHIAFVGAVVIAIGIGLTVLNILWSIKVYLTDKSNADVTGDPWGGRTLDWATSSPPPFYNFAKLPEINDIDQFWYDKEHGKAYPSNVKYEEIHMPKNRTVGVVMAGLLTVFGFAFVWHIWWLVAVSLIATIGAFIISSFNTKHDYYVDVDTVKKTEEAQLKRVREYQESRG